MQLFGDGRRANVPRRAAVHAAHAAHAGPAAVAALAALASAALAGGLLTAAAGSAGAVESPVRLTSGGTSAGVGARVMSAHPTGDGTGWEQDIHRSDGSVRVGWRVQPARDEVAPGRVRLGAAVPATVTVRFDRPVVNPVFIVHGAATLTIVGTAASAGPAGPAAGWRQVAGGTGSGRSLRVGTGSAGATATVAGPMLTSATLRVTPAAGSAGTIRLAVALPDVRRSTLTVHATPGSVVRVPGITRTSRRPAQTVAVRAGDVVTLASPGPDSDVARRWTCTDGAARLDTTPLTSTSGATARVVVPATADGDRLECTVGAARPTAPAAVRLDATPAAASAAVLRMTESGAVQDVDGDGRIDLGDTVVWTYSVSDAGTAGVDDLDVTSTPDGDAPCVADTLGPGDSTTCRSAAQTITQADVDAGAVTDSATATATDPSGDTVAPAGSSGSVPLDVTNSVSLAETEPTGVTQAGQEAGYSFTVTDSGTTTLTGVSVSDVLSPPAGTTLTANCPSTPLSPGTSTTCTANYPVTQTDVDHGSIADSARASASTPAGTAVRSATLRGSTSIAAAAQLSVTGGSVPATVQHVGDVLDDTWTVTNSGNVTVTGLAVSANPAAPAGTTPIGATCVDTAVAPGAATTCSISYTVTQADLDSGAVLVTGTATATDPGGRTVTSTAVPVDVPVQVDDDLVVTDRVTPTTVDAVGQTLDYTFMVRNAGNLSVQDLSTADTFTAPAGDPAPTDVSCDRSALAPGADAVCTASATVTQADLDSGGSTNSVTASAVDAVGGSTTSSPAVAVVAATQLPQLSVVASPPAPVTAPGRVTLGFAVTNTGNVTLTAPQVTDTFTVPAVVVPVSCADASVAPGATTTCTGPFRVTQSDIDRGYVTDTAVASALPPVGTSQVTAGPVSSGLEVDQEALLGLTTTTSVATVAHVGDQIGYTFTVTNTGDVTESAVSVTDVFTAPAGPPLLPSCSPVVLAPGASSTCTATYSTTQADFDAGGVTDTATAGGLAPDLSAVQSAPVVHIVQALADGALTITDTATVQDVNGDGIPDRGDRISWTFGIADTGNLTLAGLVVHDPIAGAVTCPVTALASGGTTTCTSAAPHVVTLADIDVGHVDDVATVSGTPLRIGLPDVVSPVAGTSTLLGPRPALQLTAVGAVVVGATGRIDAGDPIAWTFTVTNSGNVTLAGVGVTDQDVGAVQCAVAVLAPGAATTCHPVVIQVVAAAQLDAGSVSTSAAAAGTAPNRATVGSGTVSATVELPDRPRLRITGTGTTTDTNGDGKVDAGDVVHWSYTVVNTGDVTLSGVTADGPVIGRVRCARNVLAPGQFTTCAATPQTLTSSQAAAGLVIATATASGTTPAGAIVTSAPAGATVTTQFSTAPASANQSLQATGTGNGTTDLDGSPAGAALAGTGVPGLGGLVGGGATSLLFGGALMVAGSRRRRRSTKHLPQHRPR